MIEGLFNVVGKGSLEGITIARSVSYDEAQRTKMTVEAGGFKDMFEIVPKNSPNEPKISEDLIMQKEQAELKMLREMR